MLNDKVLKMYCVVFTASFDVHVRYFQMSSEDKGSVTYRVTKNVNVFHRMKKITEISKIGKY